MDLGLWQKGQQIDAYKEIIRLCYWYEESVCAKKEKGVFIVKEGKRRDAWVYIRTIEKRVY